MEFGNRIAYFSENADLIEVEGDLIVVTDASRPRHTLAVIPVSIWNEATC
jgi:hypothetical protein